MRSKLKACQLFNIPAVIVSYEESKILDESKNMVNILDVIIADVIEKGDNEKNYHQKSKKYKRANVNRTTLTHLIKDGKNEQEILKGPKNLIAQRASDCECNLKINGVKIHSNGRKHKLNNSAAQIRPHIRRRMEQNRRM